MLISATYTGHVLKFYTRYALFWHFMKDSCKYRYKVICINFIVTYRLECAPLQCTFMFNYYYKLLTTEIIRTTCKIFGKRKKHELQASFYMTSESRGTSQVHGSRYNLYRKPFACKAWFPLNRKRCEHRRNRSAGVVAVVVASRRTILKLLYFLYTHLQNYAKLHV